MLVPPILWEFLRNIKNRKQFYGFYGDFKTWEEIDDVVKKNGYGYDSRLILDRVSVAIKKIRSGEASFERDSMIFFEEDYNHQLLAALFYIYSHAGFLDVIDFGGALGSTYFQNRKLFDGLNVKWTVVEQSEFVKHGKKEIPEINFSYTINECFNETKNCLLLSGCIQYLDNPYTYFDMFLSYNIPYIILDRTPFTKQEDQLVLQRVSPEIYEATYPAWILSESKCISYIEKRYQKVFEWDSVDHLPLKNKYGKQIVDFKGVLFRLKNL